MELTGWQLLAAWGVDALVGDPPLPWPHPVVLVGRGVTRLETALRRADDSPGALRAKGALLWAGVVCATTVGGWALLGVAGAVHPALGALVSVYLAYACLATRCLDQEARAVAARCTAGDLPGARRRLSGIVGRDTEALPEPEVVRATVETVAENASDGAIAPLFYLALGALWGFGPLLALAYKAVNTLDSMVGYRDERYEHFGKFSARADDVANYLPARLAAVLVALAAWTAGDRAGAALRIALRDGRLHKSPNSGVPEAAFAGALGVQLGGTNTYRGVLRPSPRIGDPGRPLTPEVIYRASGLLWRTSALAALAGAGAVWLG